jgi:ferrous iron transport protein A
MLLGDLKIGEQARITAFTKGNDTYRQQLLSMGLLPGSILTVSRIAPFGDPIEIRVRGISLSLRKKEAEILQLERLELEHVKK